MSNTNLPRVPKASPPLPVQRRKLLLLIALIAVALVGGGAISRRVLFDAPARPASR